MILWGTYPPDPRVRREAEFLADKGHTVDLYCTNDGSQPSTEHIGGVDIYRIQAKNSNPIRQASFHLGLVDPIWGATIRKITAAKNYDIIHVHDLPPVRTVRLFNQCSTARIVCDFHELYPESLATQKRVMSRYQRVLRPHWRYKKYERKAIKNCGGLITESNVARYHFETSYDLKTTPVTAIRNVPDIEHLNAELGHDDSPADEGDNDDKFRITYVGNFTHQRDLVTLLEAFAVVNERRPETELYLVGAGEITQQLRRTAVFLGIERDVTFTGWVDFEQVLKYLTTTDVGICTWKDTDRDAKCTLPNKLFQYMYCGVPSITSDLPAMAEVVRSETSGVLVTPEHEEELASAIHQLIDEPSKQNELAANARRAVHERYNFANEGMHLVRLYEQVLK